MGFRRLILVGVFTGIYVRKLSDLMNICMIAIWLIGFFSTFCSYWIFSIGSVLILYATGLYIYLNRVKKWLQVPCKVIDVTTKKYHLIRLLQRFATTVYIPEVRYQYAINGQIYERDLIGPTKRDAWFVDKNAAYAFVQKLKRQKDTQAYINPKKPTQAVLSQELSMATFFHITGAFLSGIIPIFIGVLCQTIPYILKLNV